jgi:hypothetical protein
VSPVRYELGSYIPEDSILYSQRLEHLKSYMIIASVHITKELCCFLECLQFIAL